MADNVIITVTQIDDVLSVGITEEIDLITVEVSEVGIKGDKGVAGNTTTITVSENIAAYELVNSDGSKADSSVVGKRDWLIGVANAAINSGFAGTVTLIGDIINTSWNWTAGNIVYLNGTSLSTTPPTTGFVQMIGTAKDNHTLEIKISQSILI